MPARNLFDVHGFKPSDVGLYRHTGSDGDASSLAGLLIKRGAKGSSDEKRGATNVFLFKMNAHTKPALGK